MADQDIRSNIELRVNAQQARKAQATIQETKQNIIEYGDALKSLPVEQAVYQQQRFTKALEDTQRAAKQTGVSSRALKESVSAGGDVSSNLSAVSALSGGRLGIAQDLTDTIEQLPLLRENLKNLPEAAKSAAQAIGVGTIGLTGAILALTFVITKLRDATRKEVDAYRGVLDAHSQAIELANTRSRAEIEALRDEAQQRQRILQQQADDANLVNQQMEQALGALNPFSEAIVRFNSVIGTGGGEYIGVRENAEAANKALSENVNALSAYEEALNSATLAQREATDAALTEAEVRQRIQGVVDRAVSVRIAAEERLANLTSESARAEIASLEEQILRREKYIATANLSEEATARLQSEIDDLGTTLYTIQSNLGQIDAITKYNDTVADQQRIFEQTASAMAGFNAEVRRIEEQAYAERARLESKLQDDIIKATEKAAEEAERNLQRLEDALSDLSQNLARDLADADSDARIQRMEDERDYQRDEAKALRDHLRNLRDIREQGELDDEILIAQGDFRALYFQRRQRTIELQRTQRAFEEDRADRLEAYQQQLADAQDQYARERQQRLDQYQQDIRDAQEQYKKEQAAINTNRAQTLVALKASYRAEMQDLNQKLITELNFKRKMLTDELRYIGKKGAERLALEASIQSALVYQAQQILNSIIAGGGSTTNTNNNLTVNQTNTITTGQNADALVNYINQQIVGTLKTFFGVVN